ncbi:helix-turn-helix domain-containing protein [Geoglobus sp.]
MVITSPHILTIDPHILRSINKSALRRKVLFYLYNIYPNYDYLANISRMIRSDPSNVLGCLRGMGNRYNGSSSLIELGLVEVVEREGFKYYRITNLGRQVVEYVKKVYGEV